MHPSTSPEPIKLPYQVDGRDIDTVVGQFDLTPEEVAEIKAKETQGWKFIHAEQDLSELGESTGITDVAMQCALGNVDKVLTCDLDVLSQATRESVRLRLYFVEKRRYEEACRDNARRRREREQQHRTTLMFRAQF